MKRIASTAAAAVLALWSGASPALAQQKNLAEAAQYCTAGDMQKLEWFQQNAPGMSQQQQIATSVTLMTQLAPSCQAYFGSGTPPGQCTPRQMQAMIAWNNQSGPHRIRTDCWNFPR